MEDSAMTTARAPPVSSARGSVRATLVFPRASGKRTQLEHAMTARTDTTTTAPCHALATRPTLCAQVTVRAVRVSRETARATATLAGLSQIVRCRVPGDPTVQHAAWECVTPRVGAVVPLGSERPPAAHAICAILGTTAPHALLRVQGLRITRAPNMGRVMKDVPAPVPAPARKGM